MAALNKTDAGPSCRLPSPFSLFFFPFLFIGRGQRAVATRGAAKRREKFRRGSGAPRAPTPPGREEKREGGGLGRRRGGKEERDSARRPRPPRDPQSTGTGDEPRTPVRQPPACAAPSRPHLAPLARSLTHLRRAERGPLPAERASLRPAAGRAPPAAAARPRRRPPCPCLLAEKFPKEAGAAPARGGGRSSPRPALPPGKAPRPGPPARRGSRLRRDGRSTAAAPAPLVLRSYFAAGRAGREGGAERASNPRSPALGTGNVGLRPAAPARA